MDLHPGLFSTTLPGFISALSNHDIACDVVSGASHDTHEADQFSAEEVVSVDEDQPIEALRAIAPLVRRADVIHIHCPQAAVATIVSAAAKGERKPVILSTHGTLTSPPRNRGEISRWFENRRLNKKLRWAQRVTCLNAHESELLKRRGLRFEATPMPVGCDFSNDNGLQPDPTQAEKLPLGDGKRILAYFGDIDGELGLVPFFKACDDLEDELASWRIIVAGRPIDNWLELFQAGARRHGKEHLGEFVVFPNHDQQRSILEAAEIVVLPSVGPVLHTAILWAMWHGKATLASSALGIDGLEEAGAGAVAESTRKEILPSLRKLVAASPVELKSMGKKGAAFVRQRYSWESIIAQYIDLYHETTSAW
jgi:glycosyltransferase involved in cell wall biosynthesis